MCFFRKNRKNEIPVNDYDKNIDFDKLRRDLETEYTAQGVLTTGGVWLFNGNKSPQSRQC